MTLWALLESSCSSCCTSGIVLPVNLRTTSSVFKLVYHWEHPWTLESRHSAPATPSAFAISLLSHSVAHSSIYHITQTTQHSNLNHENSRQPPRQLRLFYSYHTYRRRQAIPATQAVPSTPVSARLPAAKDLKAQQPHTTSRNLPLPPLVVRMCAEQRTSRTTAIPILHRLALRAL